MYWDVWLYTYSPERATMPFRDWKLNKKYRRAIKGWFKKPKKMFVRAEKLHQRMDEDYREVVLRDETI